MRIVLARSVAVVPQRSRHTEVNQERPSSSKPNNQVLAPPLDGRNDLTLELSRDLVGIEGARQPSVGDLDPVEPPPHERRLEARADRLDLWELRHRASVASRGRLSAEGLEDHAGGQRLLVAELKRRRDLGCDAVRRLLVPRVDLGQRLAAGDRVTALS